MKMSSLWLCKRPWAFIGGFTVFCFLFIYLLIFFFFDIENQKWTFRILCQKYLHYKQFGIYSIFLLKRQDRSLAFI